MTSRKKSSPAIPSITPTFAPTTIPTSVLALSAPQLSATLPPDAIATILQSQAEAQATTQRLNAARATIANGTKRAVARLNAEINALTPTLITLSNDFSARLAALSNYTDNNTIPAAYSNIVRVLRDDFKYTELTEAPSYSRRTTCNSYHITRTTQITYGSDDDTFTSLPNLKDATDPTTLIFTVTRTSTLNLFNSNQSAPDYNFERAVSISTISVADDLTLRDLAVKYTTVAAQLTALRQQISKINTACAESIERINTLADMGVDPENFDKMDADLDAFADQLIAQSVPDRTV